MQFDFEHDCCFIVYILVRLAFVVDLHFASFENSSDRYLWGKLRCKEINEYGMWHF